MKLHNLPLFISLKPVDPIEEEAKHVEMLTLSLLEKMVFMNKVLS
jgi:hypothetical protein